MKKALLISAALLAIITLKAQVPNGSFESWTNKGTYDEPNGWWTLNSTVAISGTAQVTKETDAKTGSFSAKSKVISIFGNAIPATMGLGEGSASGGPSGARLTQKVNNISGWMKFNAAGGDSIFIFIEHTKWNSNSQSSEPMGVGYWITSGSQNTWTQFTVPVMYDTTTGNPDTIQINIAGGKMSTGGGNTATWFMVDDITLNGSVGVMEEFVASLTKIYPNPARNVVNISLPDELSGAEINMIDIYGRNVYSGYNTSVDVSAFARGQYFVQIGNESMKIVKKVVVE